MQFLALVWCSAAATAAAITLPFQESPVSVVDLPPGPQFTPAQKQRQIQLGAALRGQIVAAHLMLMTWFCGGALPAPAPMS